MGYHAYASRQTDFRSSGCVNSPPNAADGCTKPEPYNHFDWTDDGCSGREQIRGFSNFYRNLFNEPCRVHDFGYRNFGKGLTLSRDEDTRGILDRNLRTDMLNLCDTNFSQWWQIENKGACVAEANLVYGTVRNASDWSRPN